MVARKELRSPTVTVVIQTYNHEKYIAHAIESVLSQTIIKRSEIVVFDDCSIDETTAIIRRYESRFPGLFRIFVNPFNRLTLGYHPGYEALKSVNASYVAFLDGDDYWTDREKLEKQVAILDSDESLSGCAHATSIVENLAQPSRFWRYLHTEESVGFDDLVHPVTPFHTSSFMMRATYLEHFLRFYQKNPTCVSGDLVLYAVAAANGPIAFRPQAMSAYRLHPEGITNSNVHKTPFSFFHNRLRMWLEIKSLLAIESKKVHGLILAYQERAAGSFRKLNSTIVTLSDGEIDLDELIVERNRRDLLRYFDDCRVVFAVKSDLAEALKYDGGNCSARARELFFYSDVFQIIEWLYALVRRGTGTLILCPVGNLRIGKILKSVSSNSAFVISKDIADAHRDLESKSEVFLCLNHRELSLRFLDECRSALKLNVENDFWRCVRIALGKFNIESSDVVSVVN
jgi:glycosyltransferase involved in cell wall biosynthesis